MANIVLASGPIALGVFIALTEVLKWPRWTHYIWAGIAIVFGLVILVL